MSFSLWSTASGLETVDGKECYATTLRYDGGPVGLAHMRCVSRPCLLEPNLVNYHEDDHVDHDVAYGAAAALMFYYYSFI